MNKEDYNKFYIQGSDHYLIPKDVFDELFDEMENWKEENQKLKAELQLYQGALKRFQFYDILNGIKTTECNGAAGEQFQFYDILNGIKS